MIKKQVLTVLALIFAASVFAAGTPADSVSKASTPAADMKSTLDGGFYLRAGLMLPSGKYMSSVGSPAISKMGYDFQMGSQFYIGPVVADRFRFGLDVTWLDAAYSSLDPDKIGGGKGYTTLISAFGVGPLASYAIAEDFAATTYLKAVPTFALNGYTDASDNVTLAGGAALTGIWGIDVRYSIINAGFEVQFGSPTFKEISSESATEGEAAAIEDIAVEYKAPITNTRLYIGLRF